MSIVEIQKERDIATVVLNRPDKHNGVNQEILRGVLGAARALRKDRALRAVILRGEGPSFCAGLDFADFTQGPLDHAAVFLPALVANGKSVPGIRHGVA